MLKVFFLAVKPVTPALFISYTRLSFSMDEKEAEAPPVMGTIFLVIYMDTTVDHFTPLALRVRGKYIYIYGHHGRSLYPARTARAG